jgi:hypothetical protein
MFMQSMDLRSKPKSSEAWRLGLGRRHGVSGHSVGEGPLARTLEEQTARLPSDTWLWLAGAAIVGSLVLQMRGEQHKAIFVGNWAPTLLAVGIYNKLVKQHGSE